MRIDSRLVYLMYHVILIWKFNHQFSPLNTVLLTILSSLILQIFNGASYIAKYQTILKYKRLLLETGSLFLDEKFEVNYGLTLIIFFRFIDIFLFFMKIYPLVKDFIPLIIPTVKNIFQKPLPPQVDIINRRKPIFDD